MKLRDTLPLFKWERTDQAATMMRPARYLGYSYRDFEREVTVYHIIPVNFIIAFSHWLWFGVLFRWPYIFEQQHREICKRWFDHGYNMGKAGIRFREQVEQTFYQQYENDPNLEQKS